MGYATDATSILNGSERRKLKKRAAAVREDAHTLSDDLAKLGHAFGEVASARMAAARTQAEDAAAAMRERAEQTLQDTRAQVQAHPFAALGVAAGVGVAVALMLRR